VKRLAWLFVAVLVLGATTPHVFAQGEATPPPDLAKALDTVWVLIAAFLVFFMQAGFGMVEAGLTRAKNACNILMKNTLDYSLACIMFFLVGYGLMFGQGNGLVGWTGFLMADAPNPSGVPTWTFWLFQAAFCGAAATIVAGAMAERMKFHAYLIYTVIVSAAIYPIVGHWIWGGGWLAEQGFFDFAGSTVVHSVGGWISLIGTIVLGPRIGKFLKGAKPKAILGHSIPLVSLGVFLLWFGWFGFNPGSTLGCSSAANMEAIGRIAVNTNLAACAGAVGAMMVIWIISRKPDFSMTMNGALAGLVAITAPCAVVSAQASMVIGLIAGAIVVLGVILLDKIGVDDPVGAIPVHGMNGTFGTLAVGLWGQKALGLANDGLFHGGGLTQFWVQLYGNLAVVAFVIVAMGLVFYLIKKTVGLRVSREEELRGLDIGEHGMESYAGFQVFTIQ